MGVILAVGFVWLVAFVLLWKGYYWLLHGMSRSLDEAAANRARLQGAAIADRLLSAGDGLLSDDASAAKLARLKAEVERGEKIVEALEAAIDANTEVGAAAESLAGALRAEARARPRWNTTSTGGRFTHEGRDRRS